MGMLFGLAMRWVFKKVRAIIIMGESDGSDGSDGDSLELDTDNSPKDVPVGKLGERLTSKRIVINVSDTQYPIVEEVAEELGWVIQRVAGKGDWDLWWTDHQVESHTLFRMHLHQKINHFPNIYVLARKNLLALSLTAMRQRCPQHYDFFPQTWVLPTQFALLRQDLESCAEGKVRTYIVKPQALSQGRGIFLTRSLQDVLNGKRYVVQRYLKQPFLLDGLKFDLRLYVLVGSAQPLRLYLFHEGMARFATEGYVEPTEDNLQRSFIHLTNYNLNKANPKYQRGEEGHKRTATATFQRLKKMGYDVDGLQRRIEDVLVKTVIAGLPSVAHAYQYCQPQDYEGNMCFHLLGFDVLLTRDLRPLVLQVNHTPSFATDSPLDYALKKALIKDTLTLLRVTSARKQTLFHRAKVLAKHRLETGERSIHKGPSRDQRVQQAQTDRDSLQQNLLGGFRRIYPPSDPLLLQTYTSLLHHSKLAAKDAQHIDQLKKDLASDQHKIEMAEKKKKQLSLQKTPQYGFKNKIEEEQQHIVAKVQAQQKRNNFRTKVSKKEVCPDIHYVKYIDSLKRFNELMIRNVFKDAGDGSALLKLKNSAGRQVQAAKEVQKEVHKDQKEIHNKDYNPQSRAKHGFFVQPKNYRLVGEGMEAECSVKCLQAFHRLP